ncbi:MAG: hypothetical protein ACKVHT_09950 [Flavobacteriales bacterium]|tara:strand:+ start:94 stop:357 length:264 start_codon:yes stop_codon:yes gene_type:complete
MKKWYERDGEIILILVLFFPIGLYLVWNKSDWSKKYKISSIINNYPEGSKFSSIITVSDNGEFFITISDNLMILSWVGDLVKLRLQR